MTTSDSLLTAVLASPDDDTPRLIYADWLEQQGETAAAFYIRHEIANPKTHIIAPGNRAEVEILTDPFGRKQPVSLLLMPGIDGISYTVTRGFVDAVTCSCRAWLQHAEAIMRTQPVREVRLTECMEVLRDFEAVPGRLVNLACPGPAFGWLVDHAPTKRLRRLVLVDTQMLYANQEHFAATAFPGVEVVFERTGDAGALTINERRRLSGIPPLDHRAMIRSL